MPKPVTLPTLLLIPLFLLGFAAAGQANVPVTFLVTELKNDQGSVIVGIYDDEATFLKTGNEVKICKSENPLQNGKATVVCDLPGGTYAAGLFHDENGNGKLDTNLIGLPKEGYGFPNNPKISHSLPDFSEVSFSVGTEPLTIEIRVQY
jgi:uncharacterized protein (DUF2141 family)